MPAVRSQTVAAFRSDLTEEFDREPAREHWDAALRLLRFIPEGTSVKDAWLDLSAANIAAYYSSETKEVTVLERGGASDPESDVNVLSHEFVHALQDADVDLGAFLDAHGVSSDSSVAVRTLVEGEATVVSYAVSARSFGISPERADWMLFRDAITDEIATRAGQAGAPLLAAYQSFPYSVGFSALFLPWLQEGLTAYYDEPITAMVDFYGEARPGSSVVESLDCYPVDPPPGFSAVDQDSLGVIGALVSSSAFSNFPERAPSFRGDSLVVFRGDSGYAAAWTVRWGDLSRASAFAATTGGRLQLGGDFKVLQRDLEVDVLVSDDAESLAAWAPACGSKEDLPAPSQSMMARASSSRRP